MFCSDGVALVYFRVGSMYCCVYIVGICANRAGVLCWGGWVEGVKPVMFRKMSEEVVLGGCKEGSVDVY